MKPLFMVVAFAAMSLTACNCGSTSAQPVLDTLDAAPLATPDDVRLWASASAPNVYVSAAIVAAHGRDLFDGGARACPKRSSNGDTTRVEGGCTDDGGVTWFGSLELTNQNDGGYSSYTSRDFGYEGPIRCVDGGTLLSRVSYAGTFSVTGADGEGRFTVDLVTKSRGSDLSSCTATPRDVAMVYTGSFKDETWNGAGEVGRTSIGKVSAETRDELLTNGACGTEATSGSTTLKSGGHAAVITYDPQSPCEAAKWSLDGVDKGELTGVSCSQLPVEALPGLFSLVLLLRCRSPKRTRRSAP